MNIIMLDKNRLLGTELERSIASHGIPSSIKFFTSMKDTLPYIKKYPYNVDLVIFDIDIRDFEMQTFVNSIPRWLQYYCFCSFWNYSY